jgi:hypothetical protein
LLTAWPVSEGGGLSALGAHQPQPKDDETLDQAVMARKPSAGLLAHSDPKSHYVSHDYQNRLRHHGLVCNMSRTTECRGNPETKSFLGILDHYDTCDIREEACQAIF